MQSISRQTRGRKKGAGGVEGGGGGRRLGRRTGNVGVEDVGVGRRGRVANFFFLFAKYFWAFGQVFCLLIFLTDSKIHSMRPVPVSLDFFASLCLAP